MGGLLMVTLGLAWLTTAKDTITLVGAEVQVPAIWEPAGAPSDANGQARVFRLSDQQNTMLVVAGYRFRQVEDVDTAAGLIRQRLALPFSQVIQPGVETEPLRSQRVEGRRYQLTTGLDARSVKLQLMTVLTTDGRTYWLLYVGDVAARRGAGQALYMNRQLLGDIEQSLSLKNAPE
jgi:hypothetical protein